MRRFCQLLLLLIGLAPGGAVAQFRVASETTNHLGFSTNAGVIWESWATTRISTNIPPTNMPPRFATNAVYLRRFTQEYRFTNSVFRDFVPGTLHHLIWTNFLTHTNGRDMRIWSHRQHSLHWPTNALSVAWNTNSLIWGMKGFTALSPCWEGEGAPGQIPLTALTRRHVYARGHGMGDPGINNTKNGMKAWFVAPDNSLIEVKIKRSFIRVGHSADKIHRDYTIMLLDRDLPESIEPMPVASLEDLEKHYAVPTGGFAPRLLFQSEQGGMVSSGVAPLTVNTWKGGDSGSPNLIPLPGQLVFISGRSTSGPSRVMQEDMDELCRLERLNPAKYQLRWINLADFRPK